MTFKININQSGHPETKPKIGGIADHLKMNKLSLNQTREMLCGVISNEQAQNSSINSYLCSYAKDTLLNGVKPFQIQNLIVDNKPIKYGRCYGTAAEKSNHGYLYVEGYARKIDSGVYIYHAWNLSKSGSYVDFTFGDESENYSYRGVVIPDHLLWNISFNKGGIWGPIIPFLTDAEMQEVINYNNELNQIIKTEKCNGI